MCWPRRQVITEVKVTCTCSKNRCEGKITWSTHYGCYLDWKGHSISNVSQVFLSPCQNFMKKKCRFSQSRAESFPKIFPRIKSSRPVTHFQGSLICVKHDLMKANIDVLDHITFRGAGWPSRALTCC